VIRTLLSNHSDAKIVNLDLLTYAGNLENLRDLENTARYEFVKGDIQDRALIESLFTKHGFDAVVHLAAESHVDRSITNPMAFLETNIIGTATLLHAAKNAWDGDMEGKCFYHISTDEVYGSLGDEGLFTEDTPYDPRSPYSSSKASSDHLVRAWHHTYGLPIVISNCSNNYGSFQFPEKLIPLMIRNIRDERPLPVYGKGVNVRDWLWVEDHAAAIDVILHDGTFGRTYNIGGLNEWRNIDLIQELIRLVDAALGRVEGSSKSLIEYVKDRAGHDMRYAIDATRIEEELGWKPSITFEKGLAATVDWYLSNGDWLDSVTSGQYQQYYQKMYSNRGEE
jgi:dTDP-glucose 4,6-dehydratase